MTDWREWHSGYAEPDSDLSRRRRSVQSAIEAWLNGRGDVDLRVVSACAGDGRDLIEVLARRADAHRVREARLLEIDEVLAGAAREHAAEHHLDQVDVRRDDAGHTGSYAGAVPADLVLMCGVFGNLTDMDVRRTVTVLPRLCAPRATVVWTRGRFESGDLTPDIRGWFTGRRFEEISFDALDDTTYRVGVHRLARPPEPLGEAEPFFTFVR